MYTNKETYSPCIEAFFCFTYKQLFNFLYPKAMGSLGLKPIVTKTKIEPKMGKKNSKVMEIEAEHEPASPATRLFHTKTLNCHIIAILGCTTSINIDAIKKGLECTLLNHPRFSSISVCT